MQYLPGLCLCCVITSRARLRPRLRLSGQGPTPDPEISVCTKPHVLRCCQEIRQAQILQHPAWNTVHMLLGSSFARWCILDAASPNNTSKNCPCRLARKAPRLVLFGLLECKEQPLTPCLHPPAARATWVQCGCHTGAALAQSRVSIRHHSPKETMLQTLQPETSPLQAANAWLNQRDSAGGPRCVPWHG